MNVENNHTTERPRNGSESITLHTTLSDDDDVHKCGRCSSEFSTLEAFIQHKLHHSCKREELQDVNKEVTVPNGSDSSEVNTADDASPDQPQKSSDDDSSDILGRGRRKKTASHKVTDQSVSVNTIFTNCADDDRVTYKVNRDGRFICHLCEKTFKTANILKTHTRTHSDQKNFLCELCETSFRTKGSLIRHNRRHTDERPYRCTLCGQSFRESGALTRHLKALTPCTEKIRFVQYREILVSKDGKQKGLVDDQAAVAASQDEVVLVEPEEETIDEPEDAVVNVVDSSSQDGLSQVHFTVEVDGTTQEQQVVVDQSQVEALAAAAASGDNLICQAIINSGIAMETEETVVEEVTQTIEMDKEVSDRPDSNQSVIEIQVKEEFVEMEVEGTEERTSSKSYKCPHCNRSFKGLNYFRFHVKGHLGYKPFKCTLCHKEFLTGYLLKKHMEIHVSERRYKCGECGKLYKTIGHVREHMRAHSNERPYKCSKCNKGYKTKNALQVHQRTHEDEKPYVCEICFRGFREKGSLVRHTRHHTGEKPFKCPTCGRGFAEHGTLNRHLRAKGVATNTRNCAQPSGVTASLPPGGCHREDSSVQPANATKEQSSADVSEDPHAVLVEFSSVVAGTQEYIVKNQAEEEIHEEVTLIEDSQNEVESQIIKVVQRIVSQSHGSGSRQIIVRNMYVDEENTSISDCGDTITIATPESLTEQVAMTLASAISDGTLLGTAVTGPTEGTVTMVTTEESVQQHEEYVITSPGEVEVQTVIV